MKDIKRRLSVNKQRHHKQFHDMAAKIANQSSICIKMKTQKLYLYCF